MTLMDLATIAAKKLKADGKLNDLDESEEINACSVKIKVDIDGKEEDWILHVQERNPQPPHRDRAVRRCCDLSGRCDP